MRSKILLSFSVLLFFACKQEPKTNFKPLNLLEHGIPLTILAPEEPEIKTMDLTVMKDLTIKKDAENYYVQLYASTANTTDVQKLKSEHLEDVKKNPYFSKLVSEEPHGFIYEKQMDSTMTSYGFKYVLIQGDQEYIFQNGLIGTFDLEAVKNMYDAVNQTKK